KNHAINLSGGIGDLNNGELRDRYPPRTVTMTKP
ncbi:hypothetical protein NPIL_429731, partial [Nephila pilipes]